MKPNSSPFKWSHFKPNLILLCVRWYCRYQLSYRDPEEMMRKPGLILGHTTAWGYVQRCAPEINQRIRPHLKLAGASYRIDEIYIKVGGKWSYLYRALDKDGNTIGFMLSVKRDTPILKRFFKKIMRADHRKLPFSVSVDKHACYRDAFTASQGENGLPFDCLLRRTKYLTNIVEQDHRFIRRRRVMQCFRSFHTAERTLEAVESMHTMGKAG
jgi:IS6 family transposase